MPPLVDITRLGLDGGRLFTNQVDGTPFAVGSTVRTIGEIPDQVAIDGSNFPTELPTAAI